jgi:hypothetical protein
MEGKVKQSLHRPRGFQVFEVLRFRDNRHLRVVRLSSAFTPQEISVVHISVRGWVDLIAIVMREGLCQRKIPITYRELNLWPSGLQRNASTNCATACPLEPKYVFRFSCDQSIRWHSVSQSITCSSSVSTECSPKDCETTSIFLRISQCNVTDFEKRTNRDTSFSLFTCVAR